MRAAWLALAMSLTLALLGGARAQEVSVHGRVVDQQGSGVAGASVELDGLTTASASDGAFAFDAVPPGMHHLVVKLDGYRTVESDIQTEKDTDVGIVTLLPSSVADVAARVVDRSSGAPLAYALVTIEVSDRDVSNDTDAQGQTIVPGVPVGKWTAVVTLSGYAPLTQPVTIVGPATDLGTLALDTSATGKSAAPSDTATETNATQPSAAPLSFPHGFHGRVIDNHTGQPIGGAAAVMASLRRVSTSDGVFVIETEGVGGNYDIYVASTGYRVADIPVHTNGTSIDLGDVALDPAAPESQGSLHGRLIDNVTGYPFAGARVDLFPDPYGFGAGAQFTFSDSDGRFLFTGFANRAWTWHVNPRVRLGADGAFHGGGPGSSTDLGDITLRAFPPSGGARVVGQVLDNATGQPLVGAAVGIASNVVLTDSAGRFVLNSSSGAYPFRVAKGGYVAISETGHLFAAGDNDIGTMRLDAAQSDARHALIHLRLVGAVNGQPIQRALVQGNHAIPGGWDSPSTLADADGVATLRAQPGEWLLDVSAAGYQPLSLRTTLAVGATWPAGTTPMTPLGSPGSSVAGAAPSTPTPSSSAAHNSPLGTITPLAALGLAAWAGRARRLP